MATRRMFQYEDLRLDRGQVFTMRDKPNDQRLLDLGYVRVLSKDERDDVVECGECGAKFVGDAERTGHGRLRHPSRPLTPEEEELRLDREMDMQERIAPLNIPAEPATV